MTNPKDPQAELENALIELFGKLSNDLFGTAHDIYYYRDTQDWHDEGLGDAESVIKEVAGELSRNEGAAFRQSVLALFQAHQQELDQARELLQLDLQKFNELWTIWGVEQGIDFNMEAIENYFQRKIGELNG